MTEAGHMGWECWAEPGGIHLNEGEFIFEVIDPISGQPLPSGQRGELVVTNLGRWGMPIIRYRTGDLVELDSEQCECGRTYVRARGGVVGRRDDMLVVRGVNVFPSSLEDLIRRDQRVAEFRVDATRTGGLTDLLIQIELDASVSSDEARESAARAIAEEIRRSIGLRLTCQPVAVTVDTSAFHPGGVVTARITCTVALADLAPLPVPGAETVQATATSPIDVYRGGP